VPNLDLVEGHIEIHGDQVAGYALSYFWAADAAATGVREAFLGQIGVRPAWRRRGLGGLLLAESLRSYQAAGYQLASDKPVMAIGGFNGTDPSPTLDAFKKLVAEGKIHWFISGGGFGAGFRGGFAGGGGPSGESSTASQITSWVTSTYTAQTIGGTTMYDLSSGGPLS